MPTETAFPIRESSSPQAKRADGALVGERTPVSMPGETLETGRASADNGVLVADQPRAIAFDVDWESQSSLREAFPDWHIEMIQGASSQSLDRDWSPRTAQLLIVNLREPVAESLGLCRGLRSQLGRAHTSLLVLVPPDQEALVQAALEAGANSCLVLPVHAKELANMVNHSGAGNQPGRHTLGLHPAQRADPWRDEGGES